ncbi:hypothetical protein [Meiothermus ruber]|uniref:hypothetical protein n=1 Tax=Meiothermus ruber TaxID=277 RepID=UPI0018CD5E67|nr:hypothetical protein [Meiothermus ruber]
MPTFNQELAAKVLLETLFTDEETVAQRYGITSRTIYNYRKRLLADPHFSSFFNAKKAALEREWAHELAPAIRECIAFLKRAAKAVDPKSPEAIHAVAGALKILSEVSMTREVIDARLAHADRPQRAEAGALAASPAPTSDQRAQA